MCLYKDDKYHPHYRPLIAKKDIVCYKQLVTSHFTNGYMTPYTHSVVPVKCLEKKVPFKAEIVKRFRFFCHHILGTTRIVNDGFIHVYTYPKHNLEAITFKCIIPKGTRYFRGLCAELAAKEIIFLERVNYN